MGIWELYIALIFFVIELGFSGNHRSLLLLLLVFLFFR